MLKYITILITMRQRECGVIADRFFIEVLLSVHHSRASVDKDEKAKNESCISWLSEVKSHVPWSC